MTSRTRQRTKRFKAIDAFSAQDFEPPELMASPDGDDDSDDFFSDEETEPCGILDDDGSAGEDEDIDALVFADELDDEDDDDDEFDEWFASIDEVWDIGSDDDDDDDDTVA